ncbi:calcium-dependent phosphotriesterase, partial [Auricularia subglabra TFB-10046 SS5]
IREVAAFPQGVWLENLAVRANGDLLVTRVDAAQVISVDYRNGQNEVAFDFPHTTAVLGIAEVVPDVFAVATGNYSVATGTTIGSYSIWVLDLSSGELKALKAADVPPGGTLNGVTRLDDEHVLVADTVFGVVYRVNIRTGAFTVALSGPEYEARAGPGPRFGVNGLRIVGSTLYFTNTGAKTLSRVAIHADGTANGTIEVLSDDLEMPDDFAIGPNGDVFVTLHGASAVDQLPAGGRKTRIAGGSDSTDFASPTAAHFGRAPGDTQTLYVVTGG